MNKGKIIVLFLAASIILPSLILGYRSTRDPFDLVEVSLNKKEVPPGDDLTLTLSNYGFKAVGFGEAYGIYREYPNGTLKEVDFPYAWTAGYYMIGALIGEFKQRIVTEHIDLGEYLVEKEFDIQEVGSYSKVVPLTVIEK